MKFFRLTYLLVPTLALGVCLHAGNAAARTHAPSAQARYAAWSGWHERYPVGSPDFYYQFAQDHDGTPAALGFTGAASGLADTLGGWGAPAASTYAGAAWSGASLDPTQGIRSQATASGARKEAPGSGLALPIAALGLMLYVMRRRAALQ
jgi:hypothetical protein